MSSASATQFHQPVDSRDADPAFQVVSLRPTQHFPPVNISLIAWVSLRVECGINARCNPRTLAVTLGPQLRFRWSHAEDFSILLCPLGGDNNHFGAYLCPAKLRYM